MVALSAFCGMVISTSPLSRTCSLNSFGCGAFAVASFSSLSFVALSASPVTFVPSLTLSAGTVTVT